MAEKSLLAVGVDQHCVINNMYYIYYSYNNGQWQIHETQFDRSVGISRNYNTYICTKQMS